MSTYELTTEERQARTRIARTLEGDRETFVRVNREDVLWVFRALSRAVEAAWDKSKEHTDELEELLVLFNHEPTRRPLTAAQNMSLYSELRRIFPEKQPPKKLPGQVAYEASVSGVTVLPFTSLTTRERAIYERIEAAVLATKAG